MEQVQQQMERPKEELKDGPKEEKIEKKAEKMAQKPAAKSEAQAAPEPSKPPEGAKAKLGEKKEAKEEKKREIVLKRTVVVPLADAYAKPAKKRAAKAIKMLRQYAARHAKALEANVRLSPVLNHFINARGSKKPPKKLKVTLEKDKQGNVTVSAA